MSASVYVCGGLSYSFNWIALQTMTILSSRRRVMVQCFEEKHCLSTMMKPIVIIEAEKGLMVSLVCKLHIYVSNAWIHEYNVLKDIWYLNTVSASVYYWLGNVHKIINISKEFTV